MANAKIRFNRGTQGDFWVGRLGPTPIPAPTAEFIGSPLTGVIPMAVTMTNQSTGTISSYSWVVRRSGTITHTSSSANPTFAIVVEGTYDFELTVTGPGGSNVRTRTGYLVASGAAPLTLGFDYQTPEQISIRAPLTRAVASGTLVLAEYKPISSVSWRSAGYLFQIDTTQLAGGAPVGIVNSFAGVIFDLLPNTTYDIRLTVYEPGQPDVVITGTRSTRALPAAAGAPNKTATPANFAAQLATLVPGDVLELANGTYPAFTLQEARSGSLSQPIYIRGASRGGVIVDAPTGVAALIAASHVVIENMTFEGSGVDSGTAASSACFIFNTGVSTPQTNITIRNITANGFDRFCKGYEEIRGRLVYNCTITGNNLWSDTTGSPINDTWNDDGVSGPGQGNCFFDCTITGHGDTWKLGSSSGVIYNAANFMYRVACDRTGDDLAEFDDGTGNLACYDCYVKNAGTGLSVDGVYGGPVYYFRNRVGNLARHSVKITSQSNNVALYNNTWVRPAGQNDGNSSSGLHNFYSPNGGSNYGWRVKNNLIIWRSATGDVVRWDCSMPGLDWNYNATYPATGRDYTLGSGRGTYTGLTAAKTGNAPLMANDIATVSNPFTATITMPADWTTEYTGSMDFTLAPGATVRGAGVALPNITDGFSSAAPDIGAVITGRALAAPGDKSSLPVWAATATSGQWIEVPMTNTLTSLDPAQNPLLNPAYIDGVNDIAPWNDNGSKHPNIMSAWNGGSYAADSDEMWLSLCGGHSDYGGNEIYKGSFFSDTPTWTLVRAPSGSLTVGPGITLNDGLEGQAGTISSGPWAGNLRAGAYADGRPRSVHTYHAPFHWPGVGHGLAGLPAQFYEPARNTATYPVFFDSAGEHVVGGNGAFPQSAAIGMGSCYDSSRDCLWVKGNGNTPMYRYNKPVGAIQTGLLEAVGGGYPFSGDVSMVYLPDSDCILVAYSSFTTGAYGQYLVFDCATGQWHGPVATTGSGAINTNEQGRSALRWVAALGAVCAWHNSSNRQQITTLTPPVNPRTGTWTIGTRAGTGVTPTAPPANGTYGRFAYSPRLGGFLLVNNTTGPVYFHKL